MTEKMTEEKITIAKTNTYPIIKKEGQKFKSSLTSEEALSVYIYKKNPYYRENNIVFNLKIILALYLKSLHLY